MLLFYALQYIQQGLPVFPCCWPDSEGECACGRNHQGRDIGKRPLTPNGLNGATLSSAQVKSFWTRWPSANIGIAIPQDHFVLDVDIEHKGFESLARMEKQSGFALTPTWTVITGSGGYHYWYQTPQPVRNTTRVGGYEGLDIRGTGGYAIVPPSLHRYGLRYKTSPSWNGEITVGPDKLLSLCLKRPFQKQPELSRQGVATYCEGQRNDCLSRDAGAMRRRGLSEQAIFAALKVVNQEQCSPPLADSEVLSIARSIGHYVPEQPAKRMGVKL